MTDTIAVYTDLDLILEALRLPMEDRVKVLIYIAEKRNEEYERMAKDAKR